MHGIPLYDFFIILTIEEPIITSNTWMDASINAIPAQVIDEANTLPSFCRTVTNTSI